MLRARACYGSIKELRVATLNRLRGDSGATPGRLRGDSYSYRSACVGSIADARRAGSTIATSATTPRKPTTAT